MPLKRKEKLMMTLMEALKLALSREETAVKLYQELAVKHPAIKDFFIFLQNEEQKHKNFIEKKIAEVNRG